MNRYRDLGYATGVLPTGRFNSITDVEGVAVGHTTIIRDPSTRTGVTAILPHNGNLYLSRVPAGIAVGNGHGKIAGSTQVKELGELETPIVLVNTLAVGRAIEAVVDWTLEQEGCESVCSVNAVIGETNDSPLNDIRNRGIAHKDVIAAIEQASAGEFATGAVGAGTGTMAFGFKSGIGSSSRKVKCADEVYTVGVLVQSNFGGILNMSGFSPALKACRSDNPDNQGSIVIVLATDAPLSDRNLERLAKRSFAGLARTGSTFENGSGDYCIAFSVHLGCRRSFKETGPRTCIDLPNNSMSPLFQAAIEATEEAILDSMVSADHMSSFDAMAKKDISAETVFSVKDAASGKSGD